MNNALHDRQNLDFLLFDWLKADHAADSAGSSAALREALRSVLDLAGEVAAGPLANCRQLTDDLRVVPEDGQIRLPLELVAAMKCLRDLGFFSLTAARERGGRGLPVLAERACYAVLAAANPALCAYAALTLACARCLRQWGSAEPLVRLADAMQRGQCFGTICLAEEQAGSSLTDIQTHAIADGPHTYRLFGEKVWVAGAQHNLAANIVHLVLARVPDQYGHLIAGVQGLSLFAVPARLPDSDAENGAFNDITVLALERTAGYRGLVHCHLGFGEGRHQPHGKAGAVGWLLGPVHRGLAPLLQLMNEARSVVALSSAATAVAGYRLSLQYARQRLQGRVRGEQKADAPQVQVIWHADVRRMLIRQKCYAEGVLALNLYCARLYDEERLAPSGEQRHHAGLLLELLIPVAKHCSAQWGQQVSLLTMQVFGGAAYSAGTAPEQMYRDQCMHTIQQGTQGMQAMELLGRKLAQEDGAAFELLGETMHKTLLRSATHSVLALHGKHLARAMQALAKVSRQLLASPHPEHVTANATPYAEAFAQIVIAWIWLELALCAETSRHTLPAEFCAGKIAALRYFCVWELPQAELMLNQLALNDHTALDLPEDSF